jgi:hypothetical protein
MKEYGTYQKFEYNTCPINIPIGKAAKVLGFVFLFVALLGVALIAFWAVYTAAVFVLAALAIVGAAIVAYVAVVAAFTTALCIIVVHAVMFAVTMAAWAGVALVVTRIVIEASRIDWRMVEA